MKRAGRADQDTGGRMDNPLYTIHNRALLSESTLNAGERKALEETVAPLVGLPEKDWPSKGGTRLSLPDPIFRFNLGPSLRVFLQPGPDGRPVVLDFFHQEFLDWWSFLEESQRSAAPLEVG
jgi:hypothetical protein